MSLLHPSMPPFSESNRNVAGCGTPLESWIANPVGSVLNTCPVGAPDVTVTTSGTLLTEVAVPARYSVVRSVPLSDTHSGEPGDWSVPGEADSPQALTRSRSVSAARPGMSETRLTWWNPDGCALAVLAPAGPTAAAVRVSIAAEARAAAETHRARRFPVVRAGAWVRKVDGVFIAHHRRFRRGT